jgi:hypothetical protein
MYAQLAFSCFFLMFNVYVLEFLAAASLDSQDHGSSATRKSK